MNILQIISGRGVNGALVYCKTLCEDLVARGHNVTLVCKPNCWVADNVDPAIQVVESSLAKFSFEELRKVTRLMRDQQIDLVHTHMTRAQNFGIALKLMTGVPVVATAHNTHFELHWNFNDFVIANSKSTFAYHAKVNWVPGHRMETIYCCPDFDRMRNIKPANVAAVRRKLRLDPDDFLMTVVGEIANRKGHVHLIRALPKILEQVPTAKVVFIGRFGRKQPRIQHLRKMILDRNLAGKTKWIGRKSNVADYLAASQLTVVPSNEEPLGLVAMESLVAGTAVAASDTGGLREIVKQHETGLLFPVGNAAKLADAVIQMAGDPAYRKRLAENGRRHVLETFSVNRLIDQVEDVYNRVLNKSKAA